MTDGSASNQRVAFGTGSSDKRAIGAKSSWRENARRSFGARVGAFRDFARERRWPLVAAIAVVAVSGAGVVANVRGAASERADALEKTVAEREKRVADLDAEVKRVEDRLASRQKALNARESQIAETEEHAAKLEKRREDLQKQVAELVAPVAPGPAERVSDAQGHDGAADETSTAAVDRKSPSSADVSDTPPDESVDAPSSARVDAAGDARAPAGTERIQAASRSEQPEPEPAAVVSGIDRASASQARVFIHVRAADPAARERAVAVAAELRRRGVSVAQIRGVRLPVRRDAVRFFYDQDRALSSELQDAVRSASPRSSVPVMNDFRSFGAPPRRGTIEIWLS